MNADELISSLIRFSREKLGLDARDEEYKINRLLEILGEICYCPQPVGRLDVNRLASALGAFAESRGMSAEATIDSVMAELSLLPSEIDRRFREIFAAFGAKAATDWFYGYCVSDYYVKRAVLDRNPRFDAEGLTVTINKAKPEFRDPKKAAAGNSVAGGYPACVICRSNEGYAPRGKRNLRTVSLKLGGEDYFWQYSPYGYFNEHGIAVNCRHILMYVDRTTFVKLMDFVDMFPHYFIGCNAPLPRIGGSVLAHDHFQGGGEILPLHRAKIAKYLKNAAYPALTVGILDWPGTVVRVVGSDREQIASACEDIRRAWCAYDNAALGIISADKDGAHNAVSPTVIKTKDGYEMNVILRSNITSERYPDGVFHAHPEYHSIKKESIGLIEAQGLFILPGRLEEQLAAVADCVRKGALDEGLSQFSLVFDEVSAMGGDVDEAMKKELGSVCRRILGNTAVFNTTEQFTRFLSEVGYHE